MGTRKGRCLENHNYILPYNLIESYKVLIGNRTDCSSTRRLSTYTQLDSPQSPFQVRTILAACRIIVGCEYIFHVILSSSSQGGISSSSTTTMASPSDLTVLDITGRYTMVKPFIFSIISMADHLSQNKSLSDPRTDEILAMQGVSWLTRLAIKYGTITLSVKHFKDDNAVEHIDIDQTVTGGIPGTRETRALTWKEQERNDHVFGYYIGKSRRVPVDQLDVAFLKEGWTADTIKHGLIQSYVESDTPKSGISWIANQVSLQAASGLSVLCRFIDKYILYRPGELKTSMMREDM